MGQDLLGIVGTTVADKYAVEEAVGEGAFSVVYRAIHRDWQQPVALKCFKGFEDAPPETRERLVAEFIQEGAVLSALSGRSATIVQARDSGSLTTADGNVVPYLVLEWLDGQSLESILDEQRSRDAAGWSPEETTRFLEPLAQALAMVHRRGIAHRDIKPANIWVSGPIDAPDTFVKLLDFGVAKVVKDARADRFRKTGGYITSFTPAYGAPEQFSRTLGATGPWTDVYALGLMFVELLAGRPAVEGDDFIQLGMAAIDPARRPTPRALGVPVSDALERVLAKALSVNPEERYVDAGEFWAAVKAVECAEPASLGHDSRRPSFATHALAALSLRPSFRTAPPRKAERPLLLMAAAAALLVGSFIGSAAYRTWPSVREMWHAAETSAHTNMDSGSCAETSIVAAEDTAARSVRPATATAKRAVCPAGDSMYGGRCVKSAPTGI
ncbi:MAG TPA: serine/threonine-protein kinase [Polyangiaceae bacterium]|jgi:serine/threonine protein kinase